MQSQSLTWGQLFLLVSMSACGVTSEVSNINKNSDALVKNSEDLNSKSDELQKSIDVVAGNTEALTEEISSLSQELENAKKHIADFGQKFQMKSTSDMRQAALSRMDQSKGLRAKIVQAAIYVQAFDFQIWSPIDERLADKIIFSRDELYRLAMIEFFGVWNNYAEQLSDREIQKVSLVSEDPNVQSLVALSFVMDFVNPLQNKYAERDQFKVLHLEQGILSALMSSRATMAAPRNEWEKIVDLNRESAMNAQIWRLNSLLAASLQLLLTNDLGWKDAWATVVGLDVDLDQANQTQLEQSALFLDLALEIFKKEPQLQRPLVVNKVLGNLFKKLKVTNSQKSQASQVLMKKLTSIQARIP